jgi:hypothetical protein
VTLVPFAGRRIIPGLRAEHAGPLDGSPVSQAGSGGEHGAGGHSG